MIIRDYTGNILEYLNKFNCDNIFDFLMICCKGVIFKMMNLKLILTRISFFQKIMELKSNLVLKICYLSNNINYVNT